MKPHRISTLLLTIASLAAQDPHLVVDLNPAGSGARAFPFLGPCQLPGVLLAALDDGVRGRELWRTDGTAAGTQLVTELVPGPADANLLYGTGGANGCHFVADRGFGHELWRSDGTAAGTQLLFSAAAIGATTLDQLMPNVRVGNHWLFLADGGLWLTDGTVAGTQSLGIGFAVVVVAASGAFWVEEVGAARVHAILPSSPPGIVSFADSFCTSFRGEPILVQRTHRPFASPPDTTALIAITRPGQPSLMNLPGLVYPLQLGNGLAFVDAFGNLQHWDLANPPVQLLPPGAQATASQFQYLGDRLMFVAQDAAHGAEPWITDCTAAGTQVLDLTPGPLDSVLVFAGSPADRQRALMWRYIGATGIEPWSTDGTLAGTQMVADLEPGPSGSRADLFAGFGALVGQRRLLLPVQTQSRGAELWLTDGTPAGSRMLREIVPGPADGLDRATWQLGAAGHRLLFAADDGVHGNELWAVDLQGSSTLLHGQGSRAFDVIGDAAFGGVIEFASRGLQAQDFGAAIVGLPAVAAPLGLGGTLLLVDLGTALPLVPIVPGPGGGWSQQLAVPNLPALAGLELVAQGAFAGPSIGAGVELGAAWWLCLGN